MILSKCFRANWQLVCVLSLCVLQACAIANPRGEKYAPDQTITGATFPAEAGLDDERLRGDGRIIRDHVIKVSLSDPVNRQGMVWENDVTGSRGMISNIQPVREGEHQCRTFEATRESFDGVLVYEGKACDTSNGGWILSHFEAR